jgi:hypothetical protein
MEPPSPKASTFAEATVDGSVDAPSFAKASVSAEAMTDETDGGKATAGESARLLVNSQG